MVPNNCNYGNFLNSTQLINESLYKTAARKERDRRVKIRKEVNYIPLDKCSFCLGEVVKKQQSANHLPSFS